MSSIINPAHLRQVALTTFDKHLLGVLSSSGGEYPMPSTPEGQALVETTRAKNLVEIVERFGGNRVIRLTSEGRLVVDQLVEMNRQSKLKVSMNG